MYVRMTQYCGAFAEPLFPWNSNKYYVLCACVCSLIYPERNAHAPCYIVTCVLSGSTIFFHIIS
jgi:hypothetical protein